MRNFEADRRICDAATKGNFVVTKYQSNALNVEIIAGDEPNKAKWVNPTEHDAIFIYSARTGWPAALDYIAELETACQKYSLAIRILDNKNAELLQKTQQVDELLQKVQRLESMLVFAMGFSICNGCRHFGDDKLCGRGIMPMGSTCRKNGYKSCYGGFGSSLLENNQDKQKSKTHSTKNRYIITV